MPPMEKPTIYSQDNKNQKVITKASIGLQLSRIVRLKRQIVDIHIKDTGLSQTQWRVLFWIDKLDNCTQKELLKHLEIDAGHLARLLEKLEEKKYITRSQLSGDRRCLSIQMTEYAKQNLIPCIHEGITKEESILLKNIDEEDQKLLESLLSQLENNLLTAIPEPEFK